MTGNELRKLRATTGLTQEQFAVLIACCTARTVARWEVEDSPISDLEDAGIRVRVAEFIQAKQG